MEIKKIHTKKLEEQIFQFEGIRVVLRCDIYQKFDNYNYQRMSPNVSIKRWKENRLEPIIGSKIEAVVIDGNGNIPNQRMLIDSVRNSYIAEPKKKRVIAKRRSRKKNIKLETVNENNIITNILGENKLLQ